jgi:hypothetical protein
MPKVGSFGDREGMGSARLDLHIAHKAAPFRFFDEFRAIATDCGPASWLPCGIPPRALETYEEIAERPALPAKWPGVTIEAGPASI